MSRRVVVRPGSSLQPPQPRVTRNLECFLPALQVGYVISNARSVKGYRTGDTYRLARSGAVPLPGFRPSKPMVFQARENPDTHQAHPSKRASATSHNADTPRASLPCVRRACSRRPRTSMRR